MLEHYALALLYVLGAIIMAALIDCVLDDANKHGDPVKIGFCLLVWPLLVAAYVVLYSFSKVRKHVG